MKVLGFDPGGIGAFGCAYIDLALGEACGFTATSVDHAVDWAREVVKDPAAAGIDTLLYWQSTQSGWRGSDLYLRRRYPKSRKSVVSSNGLYGSMSVQGAVLAHRLRERWPTLVLTETHPKVLWHHLFASVSYPRDWVAGAPAVALDWMTSEKLNHLAVSDEHQFDAVLSAWAAAQGAGRAWRLDLTEEKADGQIGANISVVPEVHYYWPS